MLEKRAILQNCLPPLGILSIAACVEACGYTVQVLDVHAERLDDAEVVARIRAANPRFVGISVLTNMAIPAHRIARLAKQTVPDCVVVCGGVHAEAMPEAMLANQAVGAVVRGDGEDAMVEIMSGRPFDSIPGLSHRRGLRAVHNPPRPLEMDLDRYPMPAYHLVNFKNYFPAVGSYRNLPATNMLMTRGCPGKCTFCNSGLHHATVALRGEHGGTDHAAPAPLRNPPDPVLRRYVHRREEERPGVLPVDGGAARRRHVDRLRPR
ncbi:MAG: hypothetical protein FJZ38_05210 [Candidatus Rokubacteria bacterium]|nr:hypothetical protein [Candidatus Rokubacteria bacterium]